MSTDADRPLFDRLGGQAAIDAAVDAFHDRVAGDDRVSHYFDGVDMATLLDHQKAFFAAGTGGPVDYPGRDIRVAHAPLAIDDRTFDVFVGHLEATLVDFGLPDRERRELLDLLEPYRPDVVSG